MEERVRDGVWVRWIHAGSDVWVSQVRRMIRQNFGERVRGEVRVLSEGWHPPVEEPQGFGAQVRTARGTVVTRGSGYPPWADRGGGRFRWEMLSQPVEVLYHGDGGSGSGSGCAQ